jgi:cytidine deaminase
MASHQPILMPSLELSVAEPAAALARGVDIETLYAEAIRASSRAHAPYSGLKIGAALLAGTGETITGANVENASYGLTICAERAAIVRAVAQGHQHFTALAMGASASHGAKLASCGACLQVLAEFDPERRIIVAFPDGPTLRVISLDELLPVRFQLPPRRE